MLGKRERKHGNEQCEIRDDFTSSRPSWYTHCKVDITVTPRHAEMVTNISLY